MCGMFGEGTSVALLECLRVEWRGGGGEGREGLNIIAGEYDDTVVDWAIYKGWVIA